jgi:hypothetical protein
MTDNKIEVKVYENLTLSVTVEDKKIKFKTPKAWGGRFYHTLCNDLADAISEQYPKIYQEIYEEKEQ